MKSNNQPKDADLRGALPALKRAARRALELALQTGTPCWVLRDGKIVDIAAEARQAAAGVPQALKVAEPTPR